MGGSTLYVEAARVETGEGKGVLRTTGLSCILFCTSGLSFLPAIPTFIAYLGPKNGNAVLVRSIMPLRCAVLGRNSPSMPLVVPLQANWAM